MTKGIETTSRSQNLSTSNVAQAQKRITKHVAFHENKEDETKRKPVQTHKQSNPQDATLRKNNRVGQENTSSASVAPSTAGVGLTTSPLQHSVPPPEPLATKSLTRKPGRSTTPRKGSRRNNKPALVSQKYTNQKRGRLVHVVTVDDDDVSRTIPSFPPLPENQYTALLRRRAIRNIEGKTENSIGKDQADQCDQLRDCETSGCTTNQQEYGDVSLGMKLIVGGGRVIVQSLKALSDGRASPAQLAGVIQRGDVLLAIGDLSLVNLPFDQLMEGLKPLSTPDKNGEYQRLLELRFEMRSGLELLKSHEESQHFAPNEEAANDMFSLFPMVDQLSGTPLFEDLRMPPSPLLFLSPSAEEKEQESLIQTNITFTRSQPDEVVSSVISREHTHERERYTSKFFNWKQEFPALLKEIDSHQNSEDSPTILNGMTQSDRIEVGTTVMNIAKSLVIRMEDVDRGKDMRSFKTWSANFSLRSGASARRRYIMDSASLRSHRTQEVETSFDESVGSVDSGSLEGVDGDALLLGLAAHDGIWRKQVIDALKEAINEMRVETLTEEDEEYEPAAPDIDTALTKQLGSFLFGENISRIITKNKKSYALPPEEITTVLFDLTTHIATSAPDEITVFGGMSQNPSFASGFGALGKQKASQRADMLLANRFILDEALPIWLLAFRPFPLNQRRVLWPRTYTSNETGGTNTLGSDGDSLTVESLGSASKSPGRTKNLREMIEDQALDIETRSETCFLVTYYFTQKLLNQYSDATNPKKSSLEKEVVAFIKQFGAYLQIHSCLSFSAAVRAEDSITELLKVAVHDPSHRDAVREIQKANALTFYDTNKLSAVLTFLSMIRYELKPEKRKIIRNLCVSAYPDIQPWQVRKACSNLPGESTRDGERRDLCSDEVLLELYYKYLTMLLDPAEGHDAARHNADLIEEWCALSLGFDTNGDLNPLSVKNLENKRNFLAVASRESASHIAYKRDLVMLLDFSMKIGEEYLALDLESLVLEILENKKLMVDRRIPCHILNCLRRLGSNSLRTASNVKSEKRAFHILKRVLSLLHRMSSSPVKSCREAVVVAEEVYALLEEWEGKLDENVKDARMLSLIDFFAVESSPRDVLVSLILWSSTRNIGEFSYSRIDDLLCRGVGNILRDEISGSLLQLKHAREEFTNVNKATLATEQESTTRDKIIWRKVSVGLLSIDK